jgi:hypothetical protein
VNLVYVCPQGSHNTASSLGNETARCSTGQGAWVEYRPGDVFDPAALDVPGLSQAWAAGFVVMGLGLVTAWGFRVLLDVVKGL